MDSQNKTVLIVEDDAALRLAIEQELTRNSITVFSAPDGNAGLDLAYSLHPDLILLDLIMPGMGGSGFLTQIRSDIWGGSARIIIMTNLPSESKHQLATDLNVAGYFLKSNTSLKELVSIVLKELGATKLF
jgi:DNA-binding response OmpR family regulator